MARTRDFRRYQYEIRKLRVRRRLRWWGMDETPFWLGRYANTPKPCSCWMCGNPRKFGQLTRQELRALEK
jgi:hypothetical protein